MRPIRMSGMIHIKNINCSFLDEGRIAFVRKGFVKVEQRVYETQCKEKMMACLLNRTGYQQTELLYSFTGRKFFNTEYIY